MTKQERIKTHLRAIHSASTPGKVWRIQNIVATAQEELDAIKDLLQPEPESLAASVIRLTELLNAAEKKNYGLEQDLDAATRSNASLRRLLQSKRVLLENSEHALRHVRDQLETILEQTEQ